MDTLEKLFDSPVRSRLLKLFLMNPDTRYSAAEGAIQLRIRPALFLAEARRLGEVGLLKSAWARVATLSPHGSKSKKLKTARVQFFTAHKEFPLFPELRMLVLKSAPHAKGQLLTRIRRLGTIKLAVLAGVFIDNPNSRADLLLVGDGIKKSRLKSFIQWLEGEVGKELNYAAMSSQEYRYRMDMYDRFIRDVLEFPHETIINKLGV